jgi:tRNA threonylcarbamoyladenosine biosynthesis protein TsaB
MQKIAYFIEESLKRSWTGLTYKDFIRYSQGPDSYRTRIGVCREGIVFRIRYSIDSGWTHYNMLAKATISNGLIVPMIDARRMEVYVLFNAEYEKLRDVQAEIINDSF